MNICDECIKRFSEFEIELKIEELKITKQKLFCIHTFERKHIFRAKTLPALKSTQ
jgi:hypothetical protein